MENTIQFIPQRTAKGAKFHLASFATMPDAEAWYMADRKADNWCSKSSLGSSASFTKAIHGGDETLAAEIEELVAKIGLEMESVERVPDANVYGYAPCVAAALAGDPMAMWCHAEEESTSAPIRIWLGVTTSGGYSARDVARRGAACAALALALSRERPVELIAYSAVAPFGSGRTGRRRVDRQDVVTTVHIGASPFDAGRLSIIAHNGWQRNLCFGTAFAFAGTYCSLAWSKSNEFEILDALGREAGDIVVPCAHWQESDEVLTDPVGWVERKVRLALRGEGSASDIHKKHCEA